MSVELGVSKRTIASVMKQLSDAGLATKSGGQTSKWELTEKALSYFSLAGNEILMNADASREGFGDA